jgi:hypothetical protein
MTFNFKETIETCGVSVRMEIGDPQVRVFLIIQHQSINHRPEHIQLLKELTAPIVITSAFNTFSTTP